MPPNVHYLEKQACLEDKVSELLVNYCCLCCSSYGTSCIGGKKKPLKQPKKQQGEVDDVSGLLTT